MSGKVHKIRPGDTRTGIDPSNWSLKIATDFSGQLPSMAIGGLLGWTVSSTEVRNPLGD